MIQVGCGWLGADASACRIRASYHIFLDEFSILMNEKILTRRYRLFPAPSGRMIVS